MGPENAGEKYTARVRRRAVQEATEDGWIERGVLSHRCDEKQKRRKDGAPNIDFVLADEAVHPGGEGLLVGSSSGVGGADVAAIGFRAVLADLELAFNVRDGNAEADDAGQHGAAKAIGHGAPLFCVTRLIGGDQAFEQRGLADLVLDKFERAGGVDGDVIPGGNGERIDVKSGRYLTVGAGEDNQRLAAGEGLPVAICLGEVAFEQAVGTVVFHHQREMGGNGSAGDLLAVERAEKYGERAGLHGFDEDGAVGDLIEVWSVHGTPY